MWLPRVSFPQGASETARFGFSLPEALGFWDAGGILIYRSTPKPPAHYAQVPRLEDWSPPPASVNSLSLPSTRPIGRFFRDHVTKSSAGVGGISSLDTERDDGGDTIGSFPIRP